MTVLERLAALREPLWDDDGDDWSPLEGRASDVLDWRPRPIRFVGVVRERIREASRGWSLRHMWRRAQSDLIRALKYSTPELEWMRQKTPIV